MDKIDIFLERVEELRVQKNLSERALSLAAGSVDMLRDARRYRRLPGSERLEKLADQLGVSVDYLMARSEAPDTITPNATVSEAKVAWRDPNGRNDLPILGTALGHTFFIDDNGHADIEQTILEPTEVIRYLPRPAVLAADQFAYALYIQGDSMSPRYEPGELAIASTKKPPQVGDDVIIQLTSEDGHEVISALIKRLVRRSASWVELKQFNPAENFKVPTSRIRSIHRIVPVGDLLGA